MKTPKQKRVCVVCGTEFLAYWCHIKRGGGKTCSMVCRGRLFTGAANHHYSSGHFVGRRQSDVAKKAHHAVTNRIASGRLRRLPCERCGSTSKIEAHHDDYDRPLDVRWLCFTCHRSLHMEMRSAQTSTVWQVVS